MYQQTIVVGNLGSDPQLRYTQEGVAVCNFSVAVNERWTGQDGERKERVTWFKVAAWRKLAENCAQYLVKGSPVMVIGAIDASAWVDDQGQPRASLELTARDVRFLGSRSENGDAPARVSQVKTVQRAPAQTSTPQSAQAEPPAQASLRDDEIPF